MADFFKNIVELLYIYLSLCTREKTGETSSSVKLKIKIQKCYNAYKSFVVKHKLDMFLDEKLWPLGISFRRFVNFGERRNVKTESDSVQFQS